jgi:hypothetical protein
MNITSKAGEPAKSRSETCLPFISGSEKSGAAVPKGNIVLGVRTIDQSLQKIRPKGSKRPVEIVTKPPAAASRQAKKSHCFG